MKIELEADVFDPEFCKTCGMMSAEVYTMELCSDGQVVGIDNHLCCKNRAICRYLYDRIKQKVATETAP